MENNIEVFERTTLDCRETMQFATNGKTWYRRYLGKYMGRDSWGKWVETNEPHLDFKEQFENVNIKVRLPKN